jgi:hypothetical protein
MNRLILATLANSMDFFIVETISWYLSLSIIVFYSFVCENFILQFRLFYEFICCRNYFLVSLIVLK